MKSSVIALSIATALAIAGGFGASKAQSASPGPQFKLAQADEEVTVKKKVTPYGTKKVVKQRMDGGSGMGCKKVTVTKTGETGESVKKSTTRCG